MRRRLVTALPILLACGGRAAATLGAVTGALAGRPASAGTTDFDAGFDLAFDGYYESRGERTPLASARLRFVPGGDAYRMSLEVTSLLADLFYESSGRLDAQGLHPERYVERRQLPFGRNRRREARYVPLETDGQAGPVGEGMLAVPPGTQDRISLIGELWRLAGLAGGPFKERGSIDLALASTSKVRPVSLRVDPRAPLEIGGRRFQAWRVRRIDEGADDELDIEVWFDAAGRMLPLAIRFLEKGRALHFEAAGA